MKNNNFFEFSSILQDIFIVCYSLGLKIQICFIFLSFMQHHLVSETSYLPTYMACRGARGKIFAIIGDVSECATPATYSSPWLLLAKPQTQTHVEEEDKFVEGDYSVDWDSPNPFDLIHLSWHKDLLEEASFSIDIYHRNYWREWCPQMFDESP